MTNITHLTIFAFRFAVAFRFDVVGSSDPPMPSHVDDSKQYIANQEEHHRQESFQDEFRRLCKKYGLEIDERYVWD